ncbi:ryncolin-2-like [Saccostrea cucullata]|uniref:ryncolin-2-like n=1 Tax=Saccostrea cuccullata TaxID=36930 RepID=UPI002ED44B69
MCQRECVFFGYNSQMKKCRNHKTRLTSGMSGEAGWRYYSDNDCVFSAMPKDCKDLCEEGQTTSGVYDIYPYSTLTIPISVYCDMTTMGGGWTAIQKRVDGSVIFEKNWTEYKNGFGSPEQNVWVGDSLLDTGDSDGDLSGMSFSQTGTMTGGVDITVLLDGEEGGGLTSVTKPSLTVPGPSSPGPTHGTPQ